MVTILRIATLRGAGLIRGEALVRGRHLFQCGHPKEWRLFEAPRLLEEIRYAFFIISNLKSAKKYKL